MPKPNLRDIMTGAKPQATQDRGIVTLLEPEQVTRPSPDRREGKSNVTGYYPPEVKRQLKAMAAERDTFIEDLLAEALNDLFAKYGKPEIAPRKARR